MLDTFNILKDDNGELGIYARGHKEKLKQIQQGYSSNTKLWLT